MRTTLKIILPLIGNVVPGNAYFDRWKKNSATKGGGRNVTRSIGKSSSLPIYLRQ